MRPTEIVWLLVCFDLPTVTAAEKRAHTRFRNKLLHLGFTRLQYSVYARAYPREKATHSDKSTILGCVPPGGRVRALYVTDIQFGAMVCVDGAKRVTPEEPLGQILVFENERNFDSD